MRDQQSQRHGGAGSVDVSNTRPIASWCRGVCPNRPLVENARVAGAAENAQWP